MKNEQYCGYVAIVGRPNVGKSTLLNRILGQKLSIITRKPQTTRHQILGIKTNDNIQALYVDTPGIHKKAKREMNRLMNKAATSVISDVDVVVFVVDARYWTDEDELVFQKIKHLEKPVILVLNKIDLVKDKKRLLPRLEALSQKMAFHAVFPISAAKGENVESLEKTISALLPKGTHLFPDDQITDKDEKFLIAEIVREKLMRLTGGEVPYGMAVTVELMKFENTVLHIDAVIWVERKGQKTIIIGNKGDKLKEVGKQARLDLEKLFGCKIYLTLWVKVKEGWSDNDKLLGQLGM